VVPILLKPAAWGAHLLMLLAVGAAFGMGLWQWNVWHGDRVAAQHTLVDADPVALSGLMGGDSPFPGDKVGQPVTFTGQWLERDTMYVSHKRHQGRTGFWVVTPVRIGTSAIPVVRGWSVRAAAPAATGSVRVTGWLEPSESSGEADVRPGDRVITSMRIASMTQHVDTDLYSGFVIAKVVSAGSTTGGGPTSGNGVAGLDRVGPTQQPDVSGFTGLRNLLYSLQWWVFIVLIVFVWWRWCQDQLHPEQRPSGSGPGPGSGSGPEPVEPVDNLAP
jgi:cytochrome oxidase assembly protein ShyY1